jgi:PTH1 family peptidyl-tRNA hydrolase
VKVLAGLGNPGRSYVETPHNAGWLALDAVAERLGVRREEERCGGLLARSDGLWLFKPLSFMNRSGGPVACIMRDAGIDAEDLLVLVDDLNLPLGSLRFRAGGSSGGHKGLASIEDVLGTAGFPRLRMGIGPCPRGMDSRAFVLEPFSDELWDAACDMFERAADAALCWVREGMEAAMSCHNRTARLDEEQESQQS